MADTVTTPVASTTGPSASHTVKPRRPVRKQPCKFFATKNGCRAGDACPFLHEAPKSAHAEKKQEVRDASAITQLVVDPKGTPSTTQATFNAQSTARPTVRPLKVADSARVVQRPAPAAALQDPRKFQINQIKTRFAAKEEVASDGVTSLSFSMEPSDPDFPFEIAGGLLCTLRIAPAFPSEKPFLKVTNKEMERGYQINVERGFDTLWTESTNPTLLGMMKSLDRQLETILTGQKAAVIKLVANRGPPSRSDPPKNETTAQPAQAQQAPQPLPTPTPASAPVSAQRRDQARAKRQVDVQTIKHRLGRDPAFVEGGNSTIFTVPLEPRKRDSLPVALKAIKSVRLYVPESYDIDPCSIELLGVEGQEVVNVEEAFLKRAKQMSEMSLLAHLNYLTQNIHAMAAEQSKVLPVAPPPPESVASAPPGSLTAPMNQPSVAPAKQDISEEDNSHIKIIPRPLEWTTHSAIGQDEESDDSTDFSDSEYDDSGEEGVEDHATTDSKSASATREKGIMLSLPHLELYNIELLELSSLSLTVKCERCKETMDVSNVKNNDKGDHTGMRSESCKKCAYSLGIGWRKDLMHANSIRAGYLDLEGCTVVDLLPSHFIPTCSECSTSFVTPGVVAVRGDSAIALCRECHKKMNFKMPEVKFLAVGNAQQNAARSLPKKKAKENLGIVAGQELPRQGRCSHYRKSYRWFRFSCCSKVFPCDRCHDEQTDHPNEFANRMICGFCSREQNYRPEECGICHGNVVGKRSTGFWEGGTGTRDQKRMSRKDPRKYKRIGTSATKSNK